MSKYLNWFLGCTLLGLMYTNVSFSQEGSNQSVKFDKAPEKVLIFDLSALETYHELGIKVAGGLSNVPDYLPSIKNDVQYKGVGSVVAVDMKAAAALKPDLIIIGGRLKGKYDSLSAIAPTIQLATDTKDFWQSFRKSVLTIAAMHDKEKLAEEKLKALEKKIQLVKEKSAKDNIKSLFVLHVNQKFNPNGPGSRFGFGYDLLGLKSAYIPAEESKSDKSATEEEGARGNNRVQAPKLTEINPDNLFIIDRATGIKGTVPTLEELLTDEIKGTKAFAKKRVFVLPGNIWYLSGSGLVSVDKKITDIGRLLYNIKF